jgi:hypothetical protein
MSISKIPDFSKTFVQALSNRAKEAEDMAAMKDDPQFEFEGARTPKSNEEAGV